MEKKYIQAFLLANGIRKTSFREELLEVFIASKYGLSFKDIKDRITTTPDRVTIYRSLAIFEQKGLIHKVPDANNASKYALCLEAFSEKKLEHHHAHFICNQCDNTFCMNDIEIEMPIFRNTKGYKIKTSKLTLEGDCPDCIMT